MMTRQAVNGPVSEASNRLAADSSGLSAASVQLGGTAERTSEQAASMSTIRQISGVIDSINGYQATIASAVEEQTATAGELSRSLSEASRATSGLAGAVGDVASGAVETDRGVRTVRDTAGALTDVSQQLTDVVAVFTTR
jgi:methyl-accepting chemotaxis protein